MSQSLYPPDRPQTIGEVLDTAFRIFRVSLVKCLPFGIAATLIGQLPQIASVLAPPSPEQESSPQRWEWMTLYVVSVVLTTLVTSALMLRQVAVVSGQPTSAKAELLKALRRLPAFFGALILYILILAVASLPAIYVLSLRSLPLLPVSLLLTLLPLYLSVMFWAFQAAVLLRDKGPIQGLQFSFWLMRGNFWRVAAILTVALLVILAGYIVIAVLGGSIVALGATDVAVGWAFTAVIVVVFGSLLAPLGTAFMVATFGDLQVRREGTDLERRISDATAS
ncbi:MAG TPA: hypothetical protein VIL32_14905 [Steroidobacteraceae bacterium]